MAFDPDAIHASATKALSEALQQRAELDKTIAGFRQIIDGIDKLRNREAQLPAVSDYVEPGKLTDSCRYIIQQAGEPITVAEVTKRLQEGGYTLGKHLSAVYTVMQRLQANQEIKLVSGPDKVKRFKWMNDTERLAAKAARRILEARSKK